MYIISFSCPINKNVSILKKVAKVSIDARIQLIHLISTNPPANVHCTKPCIHFRLNALNIFHLFPAANPITNKKRRYNDEKEN